MKTLLCLLCLLTYPAGATSFPQSDEEIYQAVKKKLAGEGDVFRKSFTRDGKSTISLETFASIQGDFSLTPKVLSNLKKFPDWLLNYINIRPDGGTYYLQILSLNINDKDPQLLNFKFSFDLPVFHQKGDRSLRATTKTDGKSFTLLAESIPDPNSVIVSAEGLVKVYPAEKESNRLWVYLKGSSKLGSWILYQALPEKLITRESSERIEQVLSNYQREEDRVRETEEGEKTKKVSKRK